MIVYHGSNSCFRNLKIHKSLVKHDSTLSNEGLGIYFSTDKEVADSYGKYLYTIEIDDKYFKDFRDMKVCQEYLKDIVKHIYSQEKVNLLDYIDLNNIAKYMYFGGLAISSVGREVYNLLESTEKWYIGTTASKRANVYRLLNKYVRDSIHAFMFNYNIKNIGVIKDTNIATIVSRKAR